MTIGERNALVEEHLDLVRRIACGMARDLGPSFVLDDLQQAGYLGLIAAADTYLEARGAFVPWAKRNIRWAIRASIQYHHETDVSPDLLVVDPVAAIDQRLDLERGIASLRARQRRVVREVDLKERTLLSVARDLGVSESRVSQLRRSAIDKLRDRLAA
ncbi:MAG: sigma-70 family RNA polymerase sigma factor [Bryobacteraceae bacterium]